MNILDQPHCPRCDESQMEKMYSGLYSQENGTTKEHKPICETAAPAQPNLCPYCSTSKQTREVKFNSLKNKQRDMNFSSFTSPFQLSSWRRRRHSSSESERLSDKLKEGENGSTTTDAIEKFLSLCIQQFETYSRTTNPSNDHNRNVIDMDSMKEYFQRGTTNDDVFLKSIIHTTSSDKPPSTCRYCKREMKAGIQGLKIHQEVCPKFPLACPNNCDIVELTREKLSSHIMEECLEATELCPYNSIGCSFQGSKANLSNHLDKTLADHLHLACEVIDDQKVELERQVERIKLQDQAIVQLNDTVVKIKQLFDQQVKLRENQDKAIEKLNELMKEHKKNASKMEKDLKTKISDLEKVQIDEGRDVVNDKLLRYPGLNGYGEHVWRINNFLKRLSRIRSGRGDDPLCSEPFYTSAFGYKVSCWAYLNGRGKELGQSLSIYACVMYGEYDAILKWPIRPQYTFTLLDQNPDVDKRKDLVRVRKVHDFKRDDIRRKGIDRPKRDERAIIVGFDDFVSMEKIENGHYVTEDSLFIRILVDIPEH